MQIYFARHGVSQANVLRVISNRDLAHALTERGQAQAAALAERLRGVSVARIYTSPILRARQSAAVLAEALGAPLETADALREFDCGIAEGRADAAAWALHDAVVAQWRSGAYHARIEGGESFLDMKHRFVPFVSRLAAEARGGDIVLVGHGSLYHSMLPLVLANVSQAFSDAHPIDNCAYVLADVRDGRLFAVEWCGARL